MTQPYQWTGELRPGPEPGTVVAELRDPFGFTLHITGTKVEGGYALTGTPGPTPEQYRIECIDG